MITIMSIPQVFHKAIYVLKMYSFHNSLNDLSLLEAEDLSVLSISQGHFQTDTNPRRRASSISTACRLGTSRSLPCHGIQL